MLSDRERKKIILYFYLDMEKTNINKVFIHSFNSLFSIIKFLGNKL